MYENFEKIVNNIPSLNTRRHAHLIYGLIRWLQPQVCVEIGSFAGYMTAWMLKALYDNGQTGVLHAIDNFTLGTSPSMLHNNMSQLGLANNLLIHDVSSEKFIFPGGINLAFVDGDHSFTGCQRDVHNCLTNGASTVIVHDTVGWWGPRDFIDNFRVVGLKFGNAYIPFDIIEDYFDSGLAVIKVRHEKPPVQYSKGDYPDGRI